MVSCKSGKLQPWAYPLALCLFLALPSPARCGNEADDPNLLSRIEQFIYRPSTEDLIIRQPASPERPQVKRHKRGKLLRRKRIDR